MLIWIHLAAGYTVFILCHCADVAGICCPAQYARYDSVNKFSDTLSAEHISLIVVMFSFFFLKSLVAYTIVYTYNFFSYTYDKTF